MIRKKYLPSKNFAVALAAAAVLVIAAVIIASAPPKQGGMLVPVAASSTAGSSWTWASGTVPISIFESTSSANASAIDPGLNATQNMARNLVSNVIAATPVSGSLDPNTAQALAANALANIPTKQYAGTTTAADLNLIPVPSDQQTFKNDLEIYGNNYYLLTAAFERIMGQDLAVVQAALAGNASLDTGKLDTVEAIYRYVARSIAGLPLPAAPTSAGTIAELRIVNDLEALADADMDIASAMKNSDTATVYGDLEAYNGIMTDLTGAIDAMDAMLGIKR